MNQKSSILLVEDDSLLGPLYTFLLQEQHYQVTTVSTPAQVLVQAEKNFDLTLLDMMLPEVSGLDLLPQILKIQPAAQIVILSNLHQPHLQQQAIAAGAQGYMIKSEFTPDTFIAAIQHFLALPSRMG